MRNPAAKVLKSFLTALLVLVLSQSLFSLPFQDEQKFLSTDPVSTRTGLIFKNPELDAQGIPGAQFLRIRGLEPRARIAASHSNISYLPPVNSQGSQGSCTAWAVGYYLKSYQENRENNRTNLSQRSDPGNICSPAFIYNMIHVNGDGGSYFSDAFKILNDFGCPSLTDMPYDDDDYTTWPDRDDYENSIPRRTQLPGGEYYWLRLDSETALNQVKQLVQDGHVLVFGINVYYNYDHVSSYGNVYAIADQSGSNRGGHAQLIVGYDDSIVTSDGTGAFRVVNSWGSGWGDSGFYWISYQAISYGSPLAYGYAYWVEDRSGYSSNQKVEFRFDHNYSRETSSWIYVAGQRKDFLDLSVNSVNREYRSFPSSNIVLDVKDLQSYLTEGADLRLYFSDNRTNGVTGSIQNFSYRDSSAPIQVTAADTPVNVSDSSQGYSSLILPAPDGPVIYVDKEQLDFASLVGGSNPPQQNFTVSNSGQGDLNWDVSDNRSWITCSPVSGVNQGNVIVSLNASGLSAGEYTGTITISASEAYNSPQLIAVSLQVYTPGADAAPFGFFDTPAAGANVSGNIPVSGWALDDIAVTQVLIKRGTHVNDPPGLIGSDGLVTLGRAFFITGSRPDVEAAYPDTPHNRRAGWGCMVLTNFLPNSGNGDVTLYAVAYDGSGHRTALGQKLIHCNNAGRMKPFGSIDTPQLGQVISGTQYTNFGWSLTPPPKMIPIDGSTLWVYVDGVPLGHPVYNQYRPDIATLFPGYLNKDGAVGYHLLDTTQFSNGLHTLSWSMTDDQGAVDGVSRYFEIQNPGTAGTADIPIPRLVIKNDEESQSMGLAVRLKEKGYRSLRPTAYQKDRIEITLEQLERVALDFSGKQGFKVIGWGTKKSEPLPVGSTLDGDNGMFYWIPGPGFLGTHVLHFALSNGLQRGRAVEVIIHIVPKDHDPSKLSNLRKYH